MFSAVNNQSAAVLKKNTGAANIGTDDGETVQEKLDKSNGFESVSSFLSRAPKSGSAYILAFYGGWAATIAGPVGAHVVHQTGYDNVSPSVGAAVAVSTIGSGEQSGLYWDADGKEWSVSEGQEFKPSMFGAYTDETNETETYEALTRYFAFTLPRGGGCADSKARYLFDQTVEIEVPLSSSVHYDFSEAIFIPSADIDAFTLTQTGSAGNSPSKLWSNWCVDTKNMATQGRWAWQLNNCSKNIFDRPTMFNSSVSTGPANGHAIAVMFDCVNASDSNWSENMRFYTITAHTPYRIFNFRRTAGGVAPKNSFARTIIKDVFVATGETETSPSVFRKPDYLFYIADDVAVYDSYIENIGGNNAGDATCFYWGGDGQNTTVSGIRIENGNGWLCEFGAAGTRKPRFLDLDDNFGFGDGLFKGGYSNYDGLEMASTYPGHRSPHYRGEFLGYLKSGVHDGSNNASVLSDSGASFPVDGVGLVGGTIFNKTDGSSGEITANDGTSIEAVLSGGTDNDWDANDVYYVEGPNPVDQVQFLGIGGRMHSGVIQGCVKNEWYELPYARPRGSYIVLVSGVENSTASFVFYANDDANSGGSASVGVLGSGANGTGGESLEIRWASGNLAPEIRWTGGSRTDPLGLSFFFFGADDGV